MSDNFDYAIMCVIGAFILLIEAHRQFSAPIKLRNQSSYKILDQIELEDLAARKTVLRGYLFYMGLYLVVYAVLLTCVQLSDFLITGAEKSGAEGSLPFDGVETFFLDREGIARPIYVSVALIALLSTGYAQKIENVMRTLAHRMAGIPSGIFKTVTRLNRLDYSSDGMDEYLYRTAAFKKSNPNVQGDSVSKQYGYILNSLRQVDYVAEAVVTPMRDTVFNQQDIATVGHLLTKQQENMEKLDEELAKPDADPASLLSRVEEEKRNLQVLFSVLYFKDQSVSPPEAHPPTSYILSKLNEKPRDFILNGLFGASLILAVIALVLGFAIEALYAHVTMGETFADLPDDEYAYRAKKAIELAYESLVIFFGVGVSVAFLRAGRIVEDRWDPYTFAKVPYGRIIRLSILPAVLGIILAAIMLALPNVVAYVQESGANTLVDALRENMLGALPHAIRYGVVMFIVAVVVVLVADQHNNLSVRNTCKISVIGTFFATVVFLLFYIAGDASGAAVLEISKFFVVCLAFLMAFALIVENAEEGEEDALV